MASTKGNGAGVKGGVESVKGDEVIIKGVWQLQGGCSKHIGVSEQDPTSINQVCKT